MSNNQENGPFQGATFHGPTQVNLAQGNASITASQMVQIQRAEGELMRVTGELLEQLRATPDLAETDVQKLEAVIADVQDEAAKPKPSRGLLQRLQTGFNTVTAAMGLLEKAPALAGSVGNVAEKLGALIDQVPA